MRARRRYHRLLGVLLALPFLWLCLTGLILNHSAELRLDQRMIRSSFLSSFYLEPPADEKGYCYQVGTRQVSQWGGQIFLDDQILPFSENLVGSIAMGPNLLLATTHHLYLLGPNAELLDSLGEVSLPATPLQGIASEPLPTLFANDQIFTFDGDLLDFTRVSKKSQQAVQPSSLSDSLRKKLRAATVAHAEISYYRLLLDLHKFSFLGGFGKWALTLSTIGLVVLALTGLMLLKKRKVVTPPSK